MLRRGRHRRRAVPRGQVMYAWVLSVASTVSPGLRDSCTRDKTNRRADAPKYYPLRSGVPDCLSEGGEFRLSLSRDCIYLCALTDERRQRFSLDPSSTSGMDCGITVDPHLLWRLRWGLDFGWCVYLHGPPFSEPSS